MRLKMVSHRDALAFAEKKFRNRGLQRLLASLSEEDREIATSQALMINSWVDLDVHVRLLAAMVEELNLGNDQIIDKMGEWIAAKQLTGVYRIFLTVLSPDYVLKRATTIFQNYFEGGTMGVAAPAPGKIECIFRGFTKQQRLAELSIKGWLTGMMKLMRVRNLQVDLITSLSEDRGFFKVALNYSK